MFHLNIQINKMSYEYYLFKKINNKNQAPTWIKKQNQGWIGRFNLNFCETIAVAQMIDHPVGSMTLNCIW